jgi:hypothetical protein
MLAGGSVFSHLDFSFTCKHPAGTFKLTREPGGGGKPIREQLTVLKRFVEGFDFVNMKPDEAFIRGGHITVPAGKAPPNVKNTTWVLAERGVAYAVYVGGGTRAELRLDLPAGSYKAEWIDTMTGKVVRGEAFRHEGGEKRLNSPDYREDIALGVVASARR